MTQHDEVYDEAVENVMKGRNAEETCKYGHMGDAFMDGGECINELISREYGRLTNRHIPPAGWSEPDARGQVTFTHIGKAHSMTHPEREGFECFFVACHGNEYTRWTYRPVDTATQQQRMAVIDLQRSLAMLDVGLNILKDVTPVTQAIFREREQAIAEVVNAKNRMAEMQDTLLDMLPAEVREQVVRGSRIGAEHLRGRR